MILDDEKTATNQTRRKHLFLGKKEKKGKEEKIERESQNKGARLKAKSTAWKPYTA